MDLSKKSYRRHWLGYELSQVLLKICPSLIQGVLSQSYVFWVFFDHWHLRTLTQFLGK